MKTGRGIEIGSPIPQYHYTILKFVCQVKVNN